MHSCYKKSAKAPIHRLGGSPHISSVLKVEQRSELSHRLSQTWLRIQHGHQNHFNFSIQWLLLGSFAMLNFHMKKQHPLAIQQSAWYSVTNQLSYTNFHLENNTYSLVRNILILFCYWKCQKTACSCITTDKLVLSRKLLLYMSIELSQSWMANP